MKCPHCNQEHPDDYQFCPETGEKIEILLACSNPKCSKFGEKIIPKDSKCCPYCGHKFTSSFDNITKEYTVYGLTFEMIYVKGGTFMMGTSDNKQYAYDTSAHRVTLSDYYISSILVTQELWEKVMGGSPSWSIKGKYPYSLADWDEWQVFLTKLNSILKDQLDGMLFAMPTEAQWEFAARGGVKSRGYRYSGSNNLGDVAWCDGKDHMVAQKAPNELGLYDMSGLESEWCYDWYGDYNKEERYNPTGPVDGEYRITRGSSPFVGYDEYFYSVFGRSALKSGHPDSGAGLRLVLNTVSNAKFQNYPLCPKCLSSDTTLNDTTYMQYHCKSCNHKWGNRKEIKCPRCGSYAIFDDCCGDLRYKCDDCDYVWGDNDELKVIDELHRYFPVNGIILGETTINDVIESNLFDNEQIQFFDSQNPSSNNYYGDAEDGSVRIWSTDVEFWKYKDDDFISHMLFCYDDWVRMQKSSMQWESLGFNWKKSYLEWIEFFKNKKYQIDIIEEPHIDYDNEWYFRAVFRAYAPDMSLQFKLTFIETSKGKDASSKDTLWTIDVYSYNSSHWNED